MRTDKHILLYIMSLIAMFALNGISEDNSNEQKNEPTVAATAEKVDEAQTIDKSVPARLPDNMLRDPFWPIGEQPEGWGQKEDGKKDEFEGLKRWELAIKEVKISGISKDHEGNYFASIRGQGVVEKGDIITADYGGLTYSWRIKEVTQRGIVPIKLDVVPAK